MSTTRKKFDSGRFDFLGAAKFFIPITLFMMFVGALIIFYQGLNYGIDFAGGTEIQVRFERPVDAGVVRSLMDDLGYEKASVQGFGSGDSGNEFLIRTQTLVGKDDKETNQLQNAMVAKVMDGLRAKFPENALEQRRVDTVGPQVGSELKRNGILACVYSLLMILIYIGLRFDFKYAPGAVFCLIHDALVTLSILVILGEEINIQTLAAILTLIGYSLNDTIVTFDRIRENEKLYRDEDFYSVVNRSINDVLGRTILTAFSTLLAVGALYFFSDGVIRQIAFTLGVGIILGAYSTIYIASPIVILYDRISAKREAARVQAARA